ncbi:Eco57I restriction-modification methylase domain-containing protein [Mesorhizobium sophorae]|uniref:Eco57I restriction-modification methylase domain-containing protein n=1 Tax=Mesorhizobium sophorae TaxID=1300294 RepID=UPI000BA4418F|nr:restriction endonuclease subunit M [Mesorhizobium sophorae]
MSNHYLPTALRRALEKTIKEARVVAEEGARDAIRRLGVADGKAPSYLNDDEKELRRRLRAHARALGDEFDRPTEVQETKHLIEGAAYAHWHRMLFARFLAERGLLRHPEHDVAVTLEDCRELAAEEGLTDAWAVAERYAASMLPAVFRVDDPVLALDLDPVHTQKLNRMVTGLDADVFQAEDSLGWTYQFWRAAEKDAVNKSGVKIGADELPAVTQLFTEPYMVRFLLHNTLGAWWAGKVLAANPTLAQTAVDETELRAACSLPDYSFDMLRFARESENTPWRPAAGRFLAWPTEAKAITTLDPCCGSGHFLTEALAILASLRSVEEGLSAADAVAAVLRDNLHGLEIDGRCVQIAAFAVALSAWRIGGWQTLPLPHIAWVGAPPPLPKREFVQLGEGDRELEYALAALHDLFDQAPILGTLLEPSGGDLFEAAKMRQVELFLKPLIEKARRAEPEKAEGALAARGMADAAAMLHRKFVLQATNVPFLGYREMSQDLLGFIQRRFPETKGDLGYCMWDRCYRLSERGGSIALISLQHWLSLTSYEAFRRRVLTTKSLNIISHLGSGAFETISGEKVNVTLTVSTNSAPSVDTSMELIDCSSKESINEKSLSLINELPNKILQNKQLSNSSATIVFQELGPGVPLNKIADSLAGIMNGDTPRFVSNYWEPFRIKPEWAYLQSTTQGGSFSGGFFKIIRYDEENGHLREERTIRRANLHDSDQRGNSVWGKLGIAVNQMADLSVNYYFGNKFDSNVAVICPKNPEDLFAIAAFAASSDFEEQVRIVEKKMNITNATFGRVPMDLQKWRDRGKVIYANGFPGAFAQDPTQWTFHGHPEASKDGMALHVGLARLCGYRWPAENDTDIRVSDEARAWVTRAAELPQGDNDGLLGVPAVAGERSLADRLRAYLSAAFGQKWCDDLERRLVAEADEVVDKKKARDGSFEAWLRDRAFRQHCALFGQRPFLWHISDGLKDGFSVFIHYHRFDQATLRKLTYTMLGDWLARARAEGNELRYEKGRELQQMLEKVLEGEKPYDIFVRWKSLDQQPLGWEPDLNDGVRQNIRPFIEAGILTHDLSKILKDKDRGNDVASAPWYSTFKGERRNDHHTTLAEKQAARELVKKRVGAK